MGARTLLVPDRGGVFVAGSGVPRRYRYRVLEHIQLAAIPNWKP